MNRTAFWSRMSFSAMSAVIGLGLAASALGQDSGYRIGEGSTAPPAQSNDAATPPGNDAAAPNTAPVAPETSGPVRMARFSYLNGNVTWRPDPQTEWAAATNNMPLREGAEIWVGDGGRAELQFDDGSYVRFGSGAVATLQTLFSDAQGEFTEIKLTDGLASMQLRTDHSVFQIDTPKGAIKSTGPSRVRVGVDEDVEVGVRQGAALLDRPDGKLNLKDGDYVDVQSPDATPQIMGLPPEDSWDKFTDERAALMTHQDPNLPQNIRNIGGDLDQYGTWQDDSQYGKVWVPQQTPEWRPYQDGHWVWSDPFGWTWVGAEPWGWAPYHYGSWIHRRWGWCWVPGPEYQYWSPGVVDFSCYGDAVCWTPLAPAECVYPAAFGLGVWGVGWGLWFSIGFCGVWGPHGDRFCYERPWNNHWVNHFHGYGPGGFDRPGLGERSSLVGSHFRPSNAAFATFSANRNNLGAGHYTAFNGHEGQEAFARGQSVSPGRGLGMVNGPASVARPNSGAWAGTRSLGSRPESTGILNRNVYRGSSNPYAGSRGSGLSGADAARQARESLGWSRSGSSATSGYRGSSDFGGSRSFSGGSSDRSYGSAGASGSRAPSRNWSVSDHSGWSHVHSDSHSSGGSRGGGGRH
jgi:hypothetical protein